ncbi:pseudouridine synthase [Leptothrix cholodnii SP-6]|uniref:Pseudouridine synthase n=1 Tax=Leptothrix cholodnii (strain ATCC 51168 / LMG 8142 / SP-6) TaxID=395495 RepID=B1XZJ7_LEPCP|nr:pseudouridine synthase [Leptothrix cholodnii]ACB36560.1 pseudouridine synthase [Leptothrix cholodnii SP-6]
MSRPKPAWRPPTRDGVGPSCVATLPGAWPGAADFLAERLPVLTADQWRERMAAGDVLAVDGRPLPPDAPHVAHTRLWYWRALPAEPRIPFEAEVLFQDAHLVAVDKPHFLPMTPKGRYVQETLLVRLKRQLGIDTLVPMHRLDRETAGVVLFTVQPATRHAYQSLLRDRSVEKVYEAVAPWRADLALPLTRCSRLQERADAFMQMAEVAGEPNAQTSIELIRRVAAAEPLALYRLRPRTGQKHQLRAHMAALGLPIRGDRIYPVLQPDLAEGAQPDYSRPLQLLARSIAFTDPVSGAPRRFESRRVLTVD